MKDGSRWAPQCWTALPVALMRRFQSQTISIVRPLPDLHQKLTNKVVILMLVTWESGFNQREQGPRRRSLGHHQTMPHLLKSIFLEKLGNHFPSESGILLILVYLYLNQSLFTPQIEIPLLCNY